MSADTIAIDGAAVLISAPASGDTAAGYAMGGSNQVDVLWAQGQVYNAYGIVLAGYGLDGSTVFQNTITPSDSQHPYNFSQLEIAGQQGSGVMVAFSSQQVTTMGGETPGSVQAMVFDTAGSELSSLIFTGYFGGGGSSGSYFEPAVYATPSGYHLEMTFENLEGNTPSSPNLFERNQFDYSDTGQPNAASAIETEGQVIVPYAATQIGGADFTIQGNQAQVGSDAPVILPGESSGEVSDVAAAGLASGTTAAVAWVDSGTDYVSIFNASTSSFGPVIGLDWGGASDLHVVALNDGGFAVSWENGGAYKGEVFDGAGNGGGIMSLTGDFAGIASNGDLYTVGLNSSGQEVIQTYAISGSGNGLPPGIGEGFPPNPGNSTAYTADPSYTAPDGVSTIYLAGSNQTIHANNAGDVIWSDNTSNTLIGGTGADTFHLGRAGDIVTGGGGADTFDFAEIPWAGGQITDFQAGDTLDLNGLMSTTQDQGSFGFTDGYLQITQDSAGDAQVWAQYATSGVDSGWWLVTTLDGVSASSLQTHGDTVTLSEITGPTAVSTSDSNYTAPSNVTAITLTGSQQHIDASATSNVTIISNNTGNVLIGGVGDDIFHLGRGGDMVTGGSGANDFAYAETPWAGGTITNFNGASDEIDVSGLLAKSGYTGSDPFADGYLKYTSDPIGDAQLWSDIHQSGNDGWWLVATLDGVSTSSLHYSNGMIT